MAHRGGRYYERLNWFMFFVTIISRYRNLRGCYAIHFIIYVCRVIINYYDRRLRVVLINCYVICVAGRKGLLNTGEGIKERVYSISRGRSAKKNGEQSFVIFGRS